MPLKVISSSAVIYSLMETEDETEKIFKTEIQ